MNTTVRGDRFKVTPEWLEVLKAKKEADMLLHQGIGLFTSEPVKRVLVEVERAHNEEFFDETMNRLDAFNYGYILGKRAERARRKKAAENENKGRIHRT